VEAGGAEGGGAVEEDAGGAEAAEDALMAEVIERPGVAAGGAAVAAASARGGEGGGLGGHGHGGFVGWREGEGGEGGLGFLWWAETGPNGSTSEQRFSFPPPPVSRYAKLGNFQTETKCFCVRLEFRFIYFPFYSQLAQFQEPFCVDFSKVIQNCCWLNL
jgi:hypothetical protein